MAVQDMTLEMNQLHRITQDKKTNIGITHHQPSRRRSSEPVKCFRQYSNYYNQRM